MPKPDRTLPKTYLYLDTFLEKMRLLFHGSQHKNSVWEHLRVEYSEADTPTPIKMEKHGLPVVKIYMTFSTFILWNL
ncbi:hypothetical protein K2173_012686 [Erythroxylum novogranatense]|uniref:Uncharacterized protein n=1 Tax=Erythroxylum novogranatense TaxID=1862640 RepID=A0AAV8TLZ1_9ROSI|nr:hypothetical protein K2173_012428 [Erythroxylum novogranatense]KAJ8767095.1 hypothetical protein K2173_012686 [Erythroxylum novogranatense]